MDQPGILALVAGFSGIDELTPKTGKNGMEYAGSRGEPADGEV
jgi:hypothetical protein